MLRIFELPASYDLLTLREERALRDADAVILQSGRNGAAREIIRVCEETHTLDEAFERAADFDELYAMGAREAARLSEGRNAAFGVIGDVYTNGFVKALDRTCYEVIGGADGVGRALRLAEGLLGGLGGYTVADARELERLYPDTSAALAVRGIDNAFTASEAKLALMEYYGDAQAVLVLEGAARRIALHELDGLQGYGDGALLVLPGLDMKAKPRFTFYDLVEIMKTLRGEDGCPWDREQTHKTLRQYLLEESYEVMDAVDADDMDALYDELGDVLLQVVFHAEIARQCGEFSHLDVTSAVCGKMIGRHPHIFADGDAKTADAVVAKWEEIKRKEKGNETFGSVLADVPRTMGAMMRACKLQKKAGAIGFDWDSARDAFAKVEEEMAEFRAELHDPDRAEQEAGDLIFAVINVLRKLKINPEVALTRTCEKFIDRFRRMEDRAGARLTGMTPEEMDALWEDAKREETGN